MVTRRNYLAIFTQPELEAALALLSPLPSAHAVAAQIYSMPIEEQVHFEWIDTTVHLLACVSDELEARVERELLNGAAGAERGAFREGVANVRRLAAAHASRPESRLPTDVLAVVYDTRQPEGQGEGPGGQ
jgi:hypothetical protein